MTRKFSSYGSPNTKLHYYAPRTVVEAVDDENRRKFEATTIDAPTGVTVNPIFVATGT